MSTILLVIPNLNQGRYLEKNLERLFSEDVSEISVVIMDAGSTDNSRLIIEKYKDKLKYWRSHPDAGQSAAINEGVRISDAERYVCWVNADDTVMPERLIDLARFLDDHRECVAAYGRGEIIDEGGSVIGMHYSRPFSPRIFASFNTICQPASLVRRSAWERVGGVDEELHFGMDYDLWWKLARIGRIGFVDGVVAQYREHPETKTRSRYRDAVQTAIDIVRAYCGYVPLLWIARLAHSSASARGRQEDITSLSPAKKIALLAQSLWRFPGVNGPAGLFNCVSFMLAPYRTIKRRGRKGDRR